MKNITIHINRSQNALSNDCLEGFYPLERLGRSMYFDLKSNK